jgi:hypothetical protein
MNPHDPIAAQQIVAEYVRALEQHSERNEWPARVDDLPYPKQTIKTAIQTVSAALASSAQLSEEMREFLQSAYVSLADYVADDLARLMREYQEATDSLAAAPRIAAEKMQGDAWRTVAEMGALAGQIARSIAEETELLRAEFQQLET